MLSLDDLRRSAIDRGRDNWQFCGRWCWRGWTNDLAIHECCRALGHLTNESFGIIIKRGLVLELPVEVAAVRLGQVFRVDKRAQGRAGFFTEHMYLAAGALVEPRL